MDLLVPLALMASFVCGGLFLGPKLYGRESWFSQRAYRRGLKAGLAQAMLPPYLQDLS
jgi:hypothetical protein